MIDVLSDPDAAYGTSRINYLTPILRDSVSGQIISNNSLKFEARRESNEFIKKKSFINQNMFSSKTNL